MPSNTRRHSDFVSNDNITPSQPNRPRRRAHRDHDPDDENEPAQPNRPRRRNTQPSGFQDDDDSDASTMRPTRPTRGTPTRPEPIESEDDDHEIPSRNPRPSNSAGRSRRETNNATAPSDSTTAPSTHSGNAFSRARAESLRTPETSSRAPSAEDGRSQLALAIEESRLLAAQPAPAAASRFDDSQLEQAERASREAHEAAERERERRETDIEARILRESMELEEQKEREREEARRRNERLLAEYGGDIEGGSGVRTRGPEELSGAAASAVPTRSSESGGGMRSTAIDAQAVRASTPERRASQRTERRSPPPLSTSPQPRRAACVAVSSSTARPDVSSPLASPPLVPSPAQTPATGRPGPHRTRTRTGSIRQTLDTARRPSVSGRSHGPTTPRPTDPAASPARTPAPPRSELSRSQSSRASTSRRDPPTTTAGDIRRANTLSAALPAYESLRARAPTRPASTRTAPTARPSPLRRSDSTTAYIVPAGVLDATALASRRLHAIHVLQTAPEDSPAYARALATLDGDGAPARTLAEEGLEDHARPPSYEAIWGDRTVNPKKWTTSSTEPDTPGDMRRITKGDLRRMAEWAGVRCGERAGEEMEGGGRGGRGGASPRSAETAEQREARGRMESQRRAESERVNAPFAPIGRGRGR
ncbi:hypothetical protein MMC18_004344 [Xylographa bjoerkii]|nr:hypothetical protein [Xylographa bjoerkii]